MSCAESSIVPTHTPRTSTTRSRWVADQPDPGHTYFHSRPAFSPDGRYLLVNGWFWHPEATIRVHDVAAAMADPRSLEADLLRTGTGGGMWRGEVVSACWLGSDRIAVSETTDSFEEGSLEDPDPDPDEEISEHAGFDTLAVLGVDGKLHARHRLEVLPGLLVPCGELVVNLYSHPSLLDPVTGRVIRAWPELEAGNTALSYGSRTSRHPVWAYEERSGRLALAQADEVAVIDIRAR